eukprot:jgi/Mesen1/1691/ME000137S00605
MLSNRLCRRLKRLCRSLIDKKLMKTMSRTIVTLMCLLMTFLVWRETIGAGKLGTPEKDMAPLKKQLSALHQKTGAKRLGLCGVCHFLPYEGSVLRLMPTSWLCSRVSPAASDMLVWLCAEPTCLHVAVQSSMHVPDWDKQREAYKARHPGCNVTRTTGQPAIMMLTGSSPDVCETSMGDHLLLQALKNKIDYCRPRGIEIFYSMASFDAELTDFWSKLPLLRLAMLKHPHVEWIWWVDTDVYFTGTHNGFLPSAPPSSLTPFLPLLLYVQRPPFLIRVADMLFDIPMASYEKYEMVVPGYYDHVYKHKDWVGLNTGVFLTRNNQWTLDLLDLWAVFGPNGKVRAEAGVLLERELPGRPAFEADDQSALVYLLNKHRDTLRKRVFLETSYVLHGYWQVLVDKYEDIMAHNSPGVIPHGDDECPFTTHFVGCKPCGNFGNKDRQRCLRQMIRCLSFSVSSHTHSATFCVEIAVLSTNSNARVPLYVDLWAGPLAG